MTYSKNEEQKTIPPGRWPLARKIVVTAALLASVFAVPYKAQAQCSSPANPIVAENCLPGNPSSEWDIASSISGAGDPSIQGFATDISVNAGQTIYFKINTAATSYRIDIYRMGYYGGMGARKIATVLPSATLPQKQPACLTDTSTNLYDCGNWAISASWNVPSTAVSGIYFAHLVRLDKTNADSHIHFVVRNDSSHSALYFQTSDESWQAYNDYGGHSLYGGAGTFDLPNRAMKVSYNRPFDTRNFESASFVYNAEYPMVRWLEANGYDVTYFTGVDAARYGSLIKNHKVYLSVGHDEYVSGPQRANVQAALTAGVNLAFFSGNEWFWKTRWENSIDGSNTPYRTMVCYKETLSNAKTDPADPPTWTGTWRDGRFSPPADGGQPENALTGTLFMVNGPGSDNYDLAIKVSAEDGKMRFWRNTSLAAIPAGQTASLPLATLGYEWDADVDNGFRPAGLIGLSTSTYTLTNNLLLDQGGIYGAGTATHRLSLYRAPSGALVFGAGTVQWSWGLDDNHDLYYGNSPDVDPDMQQATVNLFADMGVQPGSLQSGLLPATASTDTQPPTSAITAPAAGSNVTAGTPVTITGTATDAGGGMVGAVEVSVDGGQTWHPATGRANWSYVWTPASYGSATLMSRAIDDSNNMQGTVTQISVNVVPHDCPCSLWSTSFTPSVVDGGDNASYELGVTFHADYDGYITGIRFYKSAANTGTHTGHLWSSSGQLLGSVTFTSETASGWQTATFNNMVPVTAGATYIASYSDPSGHYSIDTDYFSLNGLDNPPLHAPAGANDVFGSPGAFPASTYLSSNYSVDVIYIPAGSISGAPPSLVALPAHLSFTAALGQNQTGTPPQTVNIYNQGSTALSWTASASASWIVLSTTSGTTPATLSVSVNASGLTAGQYNGTITITPASGGGSPQTISVAATVTNVLLNSSFNASSESSASSNGGTEGWAVSPLGGASNWSIVNQALQYSATSGESLLYAGNSAWGDYTMQVGLKLSTLSNYPAGFRGRVDPSSGASYAVWLYPAQGTITLFKTVAWKIDSGYTQLGTASISYDTQNFHTYSLSFQGSKIQVAYDGNVVISVTDSTYATGMVALDGGNQSVAYSNVLVTSNTANAASLSLSPTSLNFAGTYNSANPPSQTISLGTSGTGVLAWTATSTAPWLTVAPSNGPSPASLSVSASAANLAPGTYTGNIRVASFGASNSPQSIPVTFTVTAAPNGLALSPSSLSFSVLPNQSNPPAQNVNVSNAGYGPLNWNASASPSWLAVTPNAGTTTTTASVSVNPSGLAVGTYSGTVTVSSAGVSNSPQTLPVTLFIFGQDLSENFSDLASGWIISPMGNAAGWSVANGTYSFNGAGASQSCAGNSAWTDYTFDTNIRLSTASNWPGGVRARVNPATGAGYLVWLYPSNGLAILFKVGQWDVNGSVLTQLAQAPLSFDTTTFHDLQVAFSGSQITVSWDGKQIITATDSSYTSGFVCLDTGNQPISYQNVRVVAPQAPASLTASPSSLALNAVSGAASVSQTVNLSTGSATMAWGYTSSAAWLTASAPSFLTPGAITISANPNGLAAGTYSGTITISAPGATNSPLTIPVTFTVGPPVLSVTPASFTFFGTASANPASQSIALASSGTGVANWTASADSSWIGFSPTSGVTPSSVAVSVNGSGLALGTHTGNLTINSNNSSNTSTVVPVTLQLGTQLLFDNFSSGAASNWTISPQGNASGWSVSQGMYNYNGQGASQAFAGSSSWTNYTVAADFKLSSLNNWPGGIRGRLNTSTGASYGVWIYPQQQFLILYRIGAWDINAQLTQLGQSATVTIDAAHTHNIRLSFNGSQIQVYYDNSLAIQATDSTYTQGAIALDVSNQPISFTNVSVIGF